MRVKLALLSVLLLTLSLLGDQGAYRLYQMRKGVEDLRRENASIRQENARLVREIESLKELDSLERLIREEWGYIREGEVLVEVPKSP